MTEVRIRQIGEKFVIEVKGHAERAEGEKLNECCAAVSTLCTAAREAFRRMEAEDEKFYYLEETNGDGIVRVKGLVKPKYDMWLRGMLLVLKAGFDSVAATYPGRISVR